MLVRIRYFASLREQSRISSEQIEIVEPCIRLAALQERLAARDPALAEAFASHPVLRVSVDFKICQLNYELTRDCEVAFFPPVTGG